MNREIMEFEEPRASQSCTFLQFHPFEFLLAAGRSDGSCDLYDLENKHLISRNDRTQIAGKRVKCLIFSENGECLFVGATEGLSTIGWEPDRNFDYIESVWNTLGDMKLINQKVIIGSFKDQKVQIHALSTDKIKPFYNPTNKPFSYNQSTRKSFSMSHQSPMKLSAMKTGNDSSMEEEGVQPFDMIEENEEREAPLQSSAIPVPFAIAKPDNFQAYSSVSYSDSGVSSQNYDFSVLNRSPPGSSTNTVLTATAASTFSSRKHQLNETFPIDDDDQHQQLLGHHNLTDTNYASDLDYYPVKHMSSASPVPACYEQPEKEDFPITNAQLPNYAPKIKNKTNNVRQKSEITQQRRISQPSITVKQQHSVAHQSLGFVRKLTNSVSTMELNKIGTSSSDHHQQFLTANKKPVSRGSSPVRNYSSGQSIHSQHMASLNKLKKSDSTTNLNRENNYKNANSPQNIQVQILTKPQRSKTLLDLKSNNNSSSIQRTQVR
jgi:katanin p80 WD40 repeat-containing subunit B1